MNIIKILYSVWFYCHADKFEIKLLCTIKIIDYGLLNYIFVCFRFELNRLNIAIKPFGLEKLLQSSALLSFFWWQVYTSKQRCLNRNKKEKERYNKIKGQKQKVGSLIVFCLWWWRESSSGYNSPQRERQKVKIAVQLLCSRDSQQPIDLDVLYAV